MKMFQLVFLFEMVCLNFKAALTSVVLAGSLTKLSMGQGRYLCVEVIGICSGSDGTELRLSFDLLIESEFSRLNLDLIAIEANLVDLCLLRQVLIEGLSPEIHLKFDFSIQ